MDSGALETGMVIICIEPSSLDNLVEQNHLLAKYYLTAK